VLRRAADDERRTGLVDQDRVDLVDDRVEVAALHQLLGAPRHVVAQVVEPELVVGAVGDVAAVHGAPLDRWLVGQDHADGQAQQPVHPAHPFGVALGEVVVGGHDVDALAGKSVEVRRKDAGQGLALAGPHLGDVAEVQGGAAHDLDVERALAEGAVRGFPNDGERLDHEVVEALAFGVPRLELLGLGAQFLIGQIDVVLLQVVDLLGDRVQPSQQATFAGAHDPVEHSHGADLLTSTTAATPDGAVPCHGKRGGRLSPTRTTRRSPRRARPGPSPRASPTRRRR
jgi:hypothetical protein